MVMQDYLEKRYTLGQIGVPGRWGYMAITLTVVGERIHDAEFHTYNCPTAKACGAFVTLWAKGKKISEAQELSVELLLQQTGPMPSGRSHCPPLAVAALKSALTRLTEEDTAANLVPALGEFSRN